ncbi:hypothetical protein MBRA_06318 [Methylobacterium brachiatum]|nr:hypothetical protein MBRA_06318 [Methylobacterium brachiatum]
MLDGRFARLLARLRHSFLLMQEKKRFLASTFCGYRAAMYRRLALSYWTPVVLGAVMLGLHLAWAIRWEPAKRGEVVTGFGACLIVLGLLVAARPYLTTGLKGAIDKEASAEPSAILSGGRTDDPHLIARRTEAKGYIIAERVVAVVVIAVGTLLNGYGPPLVRWLGLEG